MYVDVFWQEKNLYNLYFLVSDVIQYGCSEDTRTLIIHLMLKLAFFDFININRKGQTIEHKQNRMIQISAS